MKIGLNGTGLVQRAAVGPIQEQASKALDDGFTSYWLAEHPTGGFDALTVLGAIADKVPSIELGTAIIPTFPRHPMTLAAQTLTTRSIVGDRLTLGIGLSHASMMTQLGIEFDRPVLHLREYLSVLMPLLESGEVSFKGELYSCEAKIFSAPQSSCPVVVAALGEQTLRVAGHRTSGTTLAWVGPKTIRDHIVPKISAAAAAAGRQAPRIISTLPVCVTDEIEAIASLINKRLGTYGELPSYRAMFEREGVTSPAELALVGDEDTVMERLQNLADAGVTDFAASEFTVSPEQVRRTRDLLKAFNSNNNH
jgi:F420-dependent oxidoreductase-like protein